MDRFINAVGRPCVIEAIDLSKTVTLESGQELPILQQISFSVQGGESVALLGASGSGKSTLLGLLAGLDLPTAGRVCLQGKNIFELDEDQRARLRGESIGFVFQSFQLLPALSALENVMMPLELAGEPHARETARHWLERVGLGQRLEQYPKHLSGGEQQRVALARAFVRKPALLLADEPTGSLDAATGEQISALILELNREVGTTLILVTHDEQLAQVCSRQIRLAAGRIIETAIETADPNKNPGALPS